MLWQARPGIIQSRNALDAAPVVVGGGFAKGVNFNGATTLATSSTATAMTGAVDSKKWIISFWFRATANSGWFSLFGGTLSRGFAIGRTADGAGYYLIGADSAAENAATVIANAAPPAAGVWHHVIATADPSGTPVRQCFINGVDQEGTLGFAQNANNVNFAVADTWRVGSSPGYNFTNGDIAELYMAANQSMVLNTTNVQKFRSAAGRPVDLGTNGATPTGTAPTLYFSVRSGGVANDFKTNRGTGGLTWSDSTGAGAGAGVLTLASVDP
jgi:hypothetical protein